MRVVAGTARGRRLAAPRGRGVRPTADRVRESVFSMLESLAVIEGASVLDLYAGTGALGIEALSRGAARAVFVERDPDAIACLRANLVSTAVAGAQVVAADVSDYLVRHTGGSFDLVFCDPPYAFDGWEELLAGLPAGLVVAESAGEVAPRAGWDVIRVRRYGTTVITLLRPHGPAHGSVHGTDSSAR